VKGLLGISHKVKYKKIVIDNLV